MLSVAMSLGGFICDQAFANEIIRNNSVVCDFEQCAQVEPLLASNISSAQAQNKIILYQTSVQKKHFLKKTETRFSSTHNGGWQHIEINPRDLKQHNGKQFHPILGFGGSFTDSASIIYKHLPLELQKHIIESYYSESGLEYSLGRVPIASSDFSCRDSNNNPSLVNCDTQKSQYSYDDTEGDFTLSHFKLQKEDLHFKIPMIQDALKDAPNLKLFASPWSAPAWMKNNGNMVHGSLMNVPAIKQAWSHYYVNFFSYYKKNNIHFWGLTVQNEPVVDGVKQWWQTMYSTADEQAEFIQHYLGPTIKNYDKNLAIMIHDDQLSSVAKRSTAIIGHSGFSEAKNYIDGIGLHWYENELVPSAQYSNLTSLHKNLSDLNQNQFVLGTEACQGYMPCGVLSGCGPSLGSITRAESYAHDIIKDLEHDVSGWTDWNLLLDMSGGPNWAGNYVDAPILVDYNRGLFYKQPMYYYLGHFSKFVRPGSKMLNAQSEGPFPLEQVSYLIPQTENTPEHIVVIVLNRDITGRKFYIHDVQNNRFINAEIPAKSIQTYIY